MPQNLLYLSLSAPERLEWMLFLFSKSHPSRANIYCVILKTLSSLEYSFNLVPHKCTTKLISFTCIATNNSVRNFVAMGDEIDGMISSFVASCLFMCVFMYSYKYLIYLYIYI